MTVTPKRGDLCTVAGHPTRAAILVCDERTDAQEAVALLLADLDEARVAMLLDADLADRRGPGRRHRRSLPAVGRSRTAPHRPVVVAPLLLLLLHGPTVGPSSTTRSRHSRTRYPRNPLFAFKTDTPLFITPRWSNARSDRADRRNRTTAGGLPPDPFITPLRQTPGGHRKTARRQTRCCERRCAGRCAVPARGGCKPFTTWLERAG